MRVTGRDDAARGKAGRPGSADGDDARKPDLKTLGLFAIGALVLVRLVEASIWWSGFVTKPPWEGFGWFPEFVAKQAQYAKIPPYRWFLETIVLPNLTLFGWLQFLTEGFLAVTLALGIFTGFTGMIATLWALNIAIGSYPVPLAVTADGPAFEPGYNHQLFVLVPLVVWATRPGRWFGVDAWLRPRFLASASPFLRWVARWWM